MATEHLLARGYRKIGLISGPSGWWAANERRRGWQEALTAAGLSIDETQIVEGDWSASSGERGLYELVKNCPDVEAVFACNDQMALGLMRAARSLGRRIPDDLAVVGFDDIYLSKHFPPGITTVSQNYEQLGKTAVNVLVDLISGKEAEKETVIPTFLELRNSCKLLSEK